MAHNKLHGLESANDHDLTNLEAGVVQIEETSGVKSLVTAHVGSGLIINCAGDLPVESDFDVWPDDTRGIGICASSELTFFVYKVDDQNIYVVEASNLVGGGSNIVNPSSGSGTGSGSGSSTPINAVAQVTETHLVLAASDWVANNGGYNQTLTCANNGNGQISYDSMTPQDTDLAWDACAAANIRVIARTPTTLTFRTMGPVPDVDIPIIFWEI